MIQKRRKDPTQTGKRNRGLTHPSHTLLTFVTRSVQCNANKRSEPRNKRRGQCFPNIGSRTFQKALEGGGWGVGWRWRRGISPPHQTHDGRENDKYENGREDQKTITQQLDIILYGGRKERGTLKRRFAKKYNEHAPACVREIEGAEGIQIISKQSMPSRARLLSGPVAVATVAVAVGLAPSSIARLLETRISLSYGATIQKKKLN